MLYYKILVEIISPLVLADKYKNVVDSTFAYV